MIIYNYLQTIPKLIELLQNSKVDHKELLYHISMQLKYENYIKNREIFKTGTKGC